MQPTARMLASMVVVSLLAADVNLTPPPSAPSLELELIEVPEAPDQRGRGWLNHAFALATLGTTMSLASAIGLGFVIGAARSCAMSVRCFDEGGSMFGGMMTGFPLAIGLSMIAFAVPLFIKGFRERYAE